MTVLDTERGPATRQPGPAITGSRSRRRAVPAGDHARRRRLRGVGAGRQRHPAGVVLRQHASRERGHVLRAAEGVVRPGQPSRAGAVLLPAGHVAARESRHGRRDRDQQPAMRRTFRRSRTTSPSTCGDTEAEILWWVPGEMHTEEWKQKVHEGVGKWYEREPVTLQRSARAQRGLSVAPRRPRELAAGAADEGAVGHAASAAVDVAAHLRGRRPAQDDPGVVLLLRRADPLREADDARATASRSGTRATTSG